uniref:Uncharacterized protein n=1 Tax=Cacopsylla melanoneura TaxID=428564 RepID=A0A8D8R7M4_9HEMI
MARFVMVGGRGGGGGVLLFEPSGRGLVHGGPLSRAGARGLLVGQGRRYATVAVVCTIKTIRAEHFLFDRVEVDAHLLRFVLMLLCHMFECLCCRTQFTLRKGRILLLLLLLIVVGSLCLSIQGLFRAAQ